jgi:hypothetical protein
MGIQNGGADRDLSATEPEKGLLEERVPGSCSTCQRPYTAPTCR